jgi:hypothetical protein
MHLFNEGNARFVQGPSQNYASLTSWRIASGHDANSFAHDPGFVSTGDLHITLAGRTPVSNNGVAIAGVTTDVDGEPRSPTTPDIGADEGVFNSLFVNDVRPFAIVFPQNLQDIALSSPLSPQASFYNGGSANQNTFTVRVTINGPAPSTTEVYNQTTTISLEAGAFPLVTTFPVTSIENVGAYTMLVTSELTNDEDPSNNMLQGTFNVLGPITAGTYLVGTSQPPPFNTLDGALNRLKVAGISGNVTLELTEASYTLTIPAEITDIPGTDVFTVTIKPAAGGLAPVATTITGNVANALIKFTDARNIIIDGSVSGGTDRSLTIINTNTSANTLLGSGCRVRARASGVRTSSSRTAISRAITISQQVSAARSGFSPAGQVSTHSRTDSTTTTTRSSIMLS